MVSLFNGDSLMKAAPFILGGIGLTLTNFFSQQKVLLFYTQKPKCCGIIGIVSTRNNAEKILQEGIFIYKKGVELLQNRGYDSAGMATMKRSDKQEEIKIILTKIASDTLNKIDCIEELHEKTPIIHKNSYIGIAHTRWATCGPKTDENSHPHFSQDKKTMLVHNGTLDNYLELKKQLQAEGVEFTSQTDSEVIVQLISKEINKNGKNLFDAITYVTQELLYGQWALLVLDERYPESIVVSRNGSPILIGLHEDSIFVASEKIAFEKYTENYISMKDGETIELNLKNRKTFYANNFYRMKKIEEKVNIQLKPKPGFRSFFEQEIFDQPETLNKTLNYGSRLSGTQGCPKLGGLERRIADIVDIDNMLIIACGSSYYASSYAATFFKRLKCFNTIQCIEGSEFQDYDLPRGNAGMICVSQSGETADIRKAQIDAKAQSVFTLGCINSVGSFLATNVECGVYINCGREVAVAATKSFTSQCIALILISIFISHHKDKEQLNVSLKQSTNSKKQIRCNLINELRQIPLAVGQTIYMVEQQVKAVANHIYNKSSLIVLGKGPCSPIAKEGALKLKELTYIHAEAFSAGELKHGPLALIDPDNPKSCCIIMIIINDEHLDEMKLACSEVKSRNALSIVISDCPQLLDKEKTDFLIEIPSIGMLTSLLPIIPLQILTNEICIIKGNPIDKPRNLAKCVTVK